MDVWGSLGGNWDSVQRPSRGAAGLSTSPLCTTAWRAWLRSWPAGWRAVLPWWDLASTVIIEVSSGAALLLRLHADADTHRRARMERFTLGFVGVCFLALAAYVSHDSLSNLIRHEPPRPPARAKRRVAREISSGAKAADAKQTEICIYLSAILPVGLTWSAT